MSMPTWHALAVDVGGSKCEALLLESSGAVVGRGRCDFADPASGRGRGGSGRSGATIAEAVRRAVDGHVLAGPLHLVTCGWMPDGAVAGLPGGALVGHAVAEHSAALALIGAEAGVVVLAGTGSLVYGRAEDGRSLQLDALGPLLGDHGSGYQIGLMAIRAAARAPWHPRHATSLAEPVYAACAARHAGPGRFNMVDYMLEPRDRAEIAALARMVDGEARAGDRIARAILRDAAAGIAETLRDVVDRLDIARAPLPLTGAGSVATRSRIYWDRLCELAARFAPGLRPTPARHPAVVGVALAGVSALPLDDPGAFRRRLLDEAGGAAPDA
ncbi:MAG: hypothetical protein IT208_16555 [Chthonomonadales bacterium]|nr:hypothetical protein [Chthonomonadales bacterium]